jgi:hypothetical protein
MRFPYKKSNFVKRYLSGDLEATAKMKTLHAAAHR